MKSTYTKIVEGGFEYGFVLKVGGRRDKLEKIGFSESFEAAYAASVRLSNHPS